MESCKYCGFPEDDTRDPFSVLLDTRDYYERVEHQQPMHAATMNALYLLHHEHQYQIKALDDELCILKAEIEELKGKK